MKRILIYKPNNAHLSKMRSGRISSIADIVSGIFKLPAAHLFSVRKYIRPRATMAGLAAINYSRRITSNSLTTILKIFLH